MNGQTGSGKTHTMYGTIEDPGILPISLKEIHARVEAINAAAIAAATTATAGGDGGDGSGAAVAPNAAVAKLEASYVEVHNGKVFDLLPKVNDLLLRDVLVFFGGGFQGRGTCTGRRSPRSVLFSRLHLPSSACLLVRAQFIYDVIQNTRTCGGGRALVLKKQNARSAQPALAGKQKPGRDLKCGSTRSLDPTLRVQQRS